MLSSFGEVWKERNRIRKSSIISNKKIRQLRSLPWRVQLPSLQAGSILFLCISRGLGVLVKAGGWVTLKGEWPRRKGRFRKPSPAILPGNTEMNNAKPPPGASVATLSSSLLYFGFFFPFLEESCKRE